jgi:hypothetical protein
VLKNFILITNLEFFNQLLNSSQLQLKIGLMNQKPTFKNCKQALKKIDNTQQVDNEVHPMGYILVFASNEEPIH